MSSGLAALALATLSAAQPEFRFVAATSLLMSPVPPPFYCLVHERITTS